MKNFKKLLSVITSAAVIMAVFSCSTMIDDLNSLKSKEAVAEYKVQHYFAAVDGSFVVPDEESRTEDSATMDEETFSGKPGELTVAAAKTVAGFTAKAFEQKEILADGSTVVSIQYDRNTYDVVFDPDGGVWSDSTTEAKSLDAKPHGTTFSAPDTCTKTGYVFAGWNSWEGWTENEGVYTSKVPVDGAYFKATWTAGEVTYAVKHYFEKLEGGYEEDTAKAETKAGVSEAQTAAKPVSAPGFTAKTITQKTIAPDSSTVVEVYYDRNTYTVTFSIGDGDKWNDDTTADKEVPFKYGQALTAPAVPVRDGYLFAGWNSNGGQLAPTMPVQENLKYTAFWLDNRNVKYIVHHSYESLGGADPVVENQEIYGIVGHDTEAAARDTTGFNYQPYTQKTIAADGSTEITINYVRKEYLLTFSADGGMWANAATADITSNVKFGAAISAPANPTKTGYSFEGWNTKGGTTAATMPAEKLTYKAIWAAANVDYTVNSFYADLNDDYPETPSASVTKHAVTGTTTQEIPSPVDGFTAVTPVEQKVVAADGSTVLNLYYTRNSYTIELDPDGGTWADQTTEKKSGLRKFGAALSNLPANPTKTGYVFNGWNTENGTIAATMPANALSYKALWKPGTVNYTLVHSYQALDLTYPESLQESEQRSGTTGSNTIATAKSKTGFTAVTPITQKTIAVDGSTVVEIKYTRNSYTLKIDPNGGTLGGSTAVSTKTVLYEAAITNPGTPVKTGFGFDGWNTKNGTIAATMPAADTTYTALWAAGAVNYKVKHSFQGLDLVYVVDENETETKSGVTGEQTTASSKVVTGFTAETPVTQATIAADGSTVVTIKYTRNSHKVTYNLAGGSWTGGATEKTVLYGDALSAVNPTKTGFVFTGWNTAGGTVSGTMPDSDVTYTAIWGIEVTASASFPGDISMTGAYAAGTGSFSVTLPSGYTTETWTYEWYVDGNLLSDKTAKAISLTKAQLGGKGRHTVMVNATMNGQDFTKDVTVEVE